MVPFTSMLSGIYIPPENVWFSDVLRGYKNGSIIINVLQALKFMQIFEQSKSMNILFVRGRSFCFSVTLEALQ